MNSYSGNNIKICGKINRSWNNTYKEIVKPLTFVFNVELFAFQNVVDEFYDTMSSCVFFFHNCFFSQFSLSLLAVILAFRISVCDGEFYFQ